jgi:hypothetical protein
LKPDFPKNKFLGNFWERFWEAFWEKSGAHFWEYFWEHFWERIWEAQVACDFLCGPFGFGKGGLHECKRKISKGDARNGGLGNHPRCAGFTAISSLPMETC